MPLIKQLVYEQCTKECKAAITPFKSKGLEVWMKVCREIGGPLSNAGLATAALHTNVQTAAQLNNLLLPLTSLESFPPTSQVTGPWNSTSSQRLYD